PSSHPISVDQTDGQSVRGARSAPLPRLPNSLASLIAGFKAKATSEYLHVLFGNDTLWQKNYWESCINTERQYASVEDYILSNPAAWDRDELNSGAL
ncbi:MAG TPA: transposase, partial [Candidatus Methylomirabilis sp.]|nr:transposase [Candidatus Methylomirabilis sp.]